MNPANVFYLSGFQTFAVDGAACLVVPRHGDPAVAMDPPEFGSAWISTWFEDLRGYPPGSDRPAYAASMLAEHGLERVTHRRRRRQLGADAGVSRRAGAIPSPRRVRQLAGELFIELKRLKSPD